MQSEPGTKTLGALLSLTPGEIHLRELRHQTSLEELSLERPVAVLALGANGVPVQVDLRLAVKWSARGWEQQLACPLCQEPSRVLRERAGAYCCARCAPRATAHHQLKHTSYWQDGGRTTADIVRLLNERSSGRHRARLNALQRELVRGTMARAEAALPLAEAALHVTDVIAWGIPARAKGLT